MTQVLQSNLDLEKKAPDYKDGRMCFRGGACIHAIKATREGKETKVVMRSGGAVDGLVCRACSKPRVILV